MSKRAPISKSHFAPPMTSLILMGLKAGDPPLNLDTILMNHVIAFKIIF